MKVSVNNFSLVEEVWHAITHGVGFLLSIAALTLLAAFASINGNALTITAVAIYGATLIVEEAFLRYTNAESCSSNLSIISSSASLATSKRIK